MNLMKECRRQIRLQLKTSNKGLIHRTTGSSMKYGAEVVFNTLIQLPTSSFLANLHQSFEYTEICWRVASCCKRFNVLVRALNGQISLPSTFDLRENDGRNYECESLRHSRSPPPQRYPFQIYSPSNYYFVSAIWGILELQYIHVFLLWVKELSDQFWVIAPYPYIRASENLFHILSLTERSLSLPRFPLTSVYWSRSKSSLFIKPIGRQAYVDSESRRFICT